MAQICMSAPSYICKERRKMTILAVTSDMIRIHECHFLFRFQKFLFLRALLPLKLSLSLAGIWKITVGVAFQRERKSGPMGLNAVELSWVEA